MMHKKLPLRCVAVCCSVFPAEEEIKDEDQIYPCAASIPRNSLFFQEQGGIVRFAGIFPRTVREETA